MTLQTSDWSKLSASIFLMSYGDGRQTYPLVSMGGRAEGLACADPGARTPIGASGNCIFFSSVIHLTEEQILLSNILIEMFSISIASFILSNIKFVDNPSIIFSIFPHFFFTEDIHVPTFILKLTHCIMIGLLNNILGFRKTSLKLDFPSLKLNHPVL